jgi:hypothetical protein
MQLRMRLHGVVLFLATVVVVVVMMTGAQAREVLVLAGGEVKDWTRFDSLFGPDFDLSAYTDELTNTTGADHDDDDDDGEGDVTVDQDCYEYEVRVEVFFGLDVRCAALEGGGVTTQISERAFEAFLDREVTPRFPQGFSVMDVPLGQWYSPARRSITKERSKAMLLLMPDTRENDRKLRAIAHSYTKTFHQETVMITKSPLFSYCFVGASAAA